jgi:hypothetical protein
MIEPFLYPPLPSSKRKPVWKRQSGDETLSSQVPDEPRCCIFDSTQGLQTTRVTGGTLLIVCGLHSANYRLDPPPFMTTQRPGFDNLHHVTDVTIVLFIMSQNLFRFSDYLFVKWVLKPPNNRHCDSLIHTATGNKTCPKLAMSSFFLAQLYPPNQSKLTAF